MTEVFEVRLSPQQRRLWLLQEIHGRWDAEVEAELAGPLDRDALDAAIRTAVERHDILRTSLQTIPGMKLPVQVIGEAGALRAEVVPAGPDRHRLTLSLPALCGDLGTLRLLLAEIGGGPVSDVPMQYWQYSEWLNELLEDETYAGERELWQRRLLGASASSPATSLKQLEPARTPALPVDAHPIRDAAVAYGVSVQVFLLAAWAVLLQRHMPERVALWVVVDGREIEELAGSLGPFARALPLALPDRLDSPFSEVLTEVKETLADFAERQRFFSWEPSRSALPFLFEYRSEAPIMNVAGARLTVLRESVPCDVSEVSLVCTEGPDRLVLEIEGAGGDLLARFATLLRSAATRPDRMSGELDILPSDERRRLLEDLNPPAALAAPERSVYELFAARAESTPEADALIFGDRRMSYAELAARSRSLARRLRGIGVGGVGGVGPEVRVGLCAEIGPEAIVGILGIWGAGGAYVPVDPHGPAERRAFFLSDSGARIVVTQGTLAADFAGERIVVDLDEEPDAGPIESGASPGNLAYVLYTSGSTGVPKGVGVEHRQLARYLAWVDQILFGDRVRTCPWITPLTFDACLKQAVLPLLRGEAVWGFPGETLDPAGLLAELASRERAGVNCTPTLWRAILDEIERGGHAPALSAVFLGGERLTPELFARTAAALPGAELWNLYGPTEATANSLVARLEPGGPVVLGRPIDGARVYLLDPRMQPAPAGAVGEIHIGGTGVARGYLGRPDLTAERFVPDPFIGEGGKGERLYRTGDLGRLTPDGQVEFLGRADQQVKIRGFRIELGEIEARLELYPEVREAAVLVRDERLTAWVVPERGSVRASELRAALREALPEYMMPAAFVVLDRLPRLPSGKVDRQSLPRSGSELAASERPFVAPRTPAERLLADIWAEVLGRERVSVEDNFFELGGHSIQSIQISHRATAAGIAITPRDLLHHPTIAGLAGLGASQEEEWEEGSL